MRLNTYRIATDRHRLVTGSHRRSHHPNQSRALTKGPDKGPDKGGQIRGGEGKRTREAGREERREGEKERKKGREKEREAKETDLRLAIWECRYNTEVLSSV